MVVVGSVGLAEVEGFVLFGCAEDEALEGGPSSSTPPKVPVREAKFDDVESPARPVIRLLSDRLCVGGCGVGRATDSGRIVGGSGFVSATASCFVSMVRITVGLVSISVSVFAGAVSDRTGPCDFTMGTTGATFSALTGLDGSFRDKAAVSRWPDGQVAGCSTAGGSFEVGIDGLEACPLTSDLDSETGRTGKGTGEGSGAVVAFELGRLARDFHDGTKSMERDFL